MASISTIVWKRFIPVLDYVSLAREDEDHRRAIKAAMYKDLTELNFSLPAAWRKTQNSTSSNHIWTGPRSAEFACSEVFRSASCL